MHEKHLIHLAFSNIFHWLQRRTNHSRWWESTTRAVTTALGLAGGAMDPVLGEQRRFRLDQDVVRSALEGVDFDAGTQTRWCWMTASGHRPTTPPVSTWSYSKTIVISVMITAPIKFRMIP